MSKAQTLDSRASMDAALAVLEDAVRGVAEVPTWTVNTAEIPAAVQALAGAEARLAAARLGLIREAVSRGLPADAGTSPTGWLRGLLNQDPHSAGEDARVAAALTDPESPTAAALAAAVIGVGHVRVITRVLAQLRDAKVDPDVVAEAEVFLVEQAADFDPLLLGRLGRALLHRLHPDADRAGQEEQRQTARRELTFYDDPDGSGMTLIRGRLDSFAAAIVQTALDPLAAPKAAADGTRDGRSPAKRRGDALVCLCEQALAGDGLPVQGGERPTVVVTMNLDTLLNLDGMPALLPTGQPLSGAAARRIACDAGILPIVLGSASEPLDIGRRTRIWPPGLRRAITQRDGGCSRPGCDRPPQWCQIHHIRPWARGGRTELRNGVMVCDTCHDLLHHGGWTVTIGIDGLPAWCPPPWTHTPNPTPRRNTWWRRLHELDYLHSRSDGHDP